MNRSGKYRAELQDTMDLILIRDVSTAVTGTQIIRCTRDERSEF